MSSKSTEVKIVTAPGVELLDRRLIYPLQGNLKTLSQKSYEKLKKSIYTEGFFCPVFITTPADGDGKIFSLDGHQRLFTLQKMTTEGYTVPDKVPVFRIPSESMAHAKLLLLKITGAHGKMSMDGLYELVKTLPPETNIDTELETWDFAEFDVEEFKLGFLVDPVPTPEGKDNQPPEHVKVELVVHNEDYPHYLRQLAELNAKFPRTRVIQNLEKDDSR